MTDFLKCEWAGECHVTIMVKDYPEQGVSLDNLKPLIDDIRSRASDMIICADFTGTGLIGIEKFKSIVSLCQEVIEYTKNDNILRKVELKGTGFIFRALYRPISQVIPKFFRDIVVFL